MENNGQRATPRLYPGHIIWVYIHANFDNNFPNTSSNNNNTSSEQVGMLH